MGKSLFALILVALAAFAEPPVAPLISQDILSSRQAPQTYTLVEKLFSDLSDAQDRLLRTPGQAWTSRVTLLKSPETTAFMTEDPKKRVKQLFISTGLLERILKHTPGEDPQAAVDRLAGIIAEEIGRPKTTTRPQSWLPTVFEASQIRTDLEAIRILRQANYPTDGLYQALQRLGATTESREELRQSAQKLLLTVERYRRGSSRSAPPAQLNPAVLNELAESQDTWTFKKPKSIGETVERLSALLSENQSEYRTIEFNRLLLTLDHQLLEAKSSIAPQTRKSAVAFMGELFEKAGSAPPIFSRKQIRSLFTPENRSTEFAGSQDHSTLVQKIPFYSSALLRQEIVKRFTSEEDPGTAIPSMKNVLSEKALVDEFGKQLLETHGSRLPSADPGVKILITRLYDKEVRPHLSFSEIVQSARTNARRNLGAYLFSTRWSLLSSNPIEANRTRYWKDRHNPELAQTLRQVAEQTWENRGLYGMIDILGVPNRLIDWNEIWRILHIDPVTGRSQLNSAVKKFAQSPLYAEFLNASWGKSGDMIPSWPDPALAPYLAGEKNPEIKDNPELRAVAENMVARYYKIYPKAQSVVLQAKTRAILNNLSNESPNEVASRFSAELKNLNPLLTSKLSDANVQWNIAEAIQSSHLPEASKQALLRDQFIESSRWLQGTPEVVNQIQDVLVANGISNSALSTLQQILSASGKAGLILKGTAQNVILGANCLAPSLNNELAQQLRSARDNPEELRKIISQYMSILDPLPGVKPRFFQNTVGVRLIKNQLAIAASDSSLSLQERFDLHQRLTVTGPTFQTDLLLKKTLDSTTVSDELARDYVSSALSRDAILSKPIRTDVASKVLQNWIDSEPSDLSVDDGIAEITRVLPDRSEERDKLLEAVAWKSRARDADLDKIEDLKSYNWKSFSPSASAEISMISGLISRANPRTKIQLLRFLIDPDHAEFPTAELARLVNQVRPTNTREQTGMARTAPEHFMKSMADKKIADLKAALRAAKPIEKTPLLEVLLTKIRPSFTSDESFAEYVSNSLMNYPHGSSQDLLLRSFLAVVPAHERTVSLAFLLARSGTNSGDISNLFEIFQTVGIKFGQMSSVWKLFGDEIAQQTEKLKDNAAPLSKNEIVEVLKSKLSPNEWSQIAELESLLASASLKVVVRAKLADGRQVVFLIQRPNAAAQVEGNLDLSLRFVQELKRRKVPIPSGMFDSVVQGMREQLRDEMKMTSEANRILEARKNYAWVNDRFASELDGWRFDVPKLASGFALRDDLLVQEVASGKSWKTLPPEQKATIGKAIVKASIAQLFDRGWFDPDRHRGNFIIDPESKTIHVIDFGQAVQFSRTGPWTVDDRELLAKFLSGISRRDADAIAGAFLKMKAHGTAAPSLRVLRKAIAASLRANEGKPVSDLIPAILNASGDAGLRLESKYSFGAIKGLLLLAGEEYVPVDQFSEIVKKEITNLAMKKPRLMIDQLTEVSGACVLRAIKGAFHIQ